MPECSSVTGSSCRVGPVQRVAGGGLAVVLAGFAVTMIARDPAVGVMAGLVAVVAIIVATTGWCPAAWLACRPARRAAEPNTLGFPEARIAIDLAVEPQNRSPHDKH